MSRKHAHTAARKCATQLLYQSEILGVPADKIIDEGMVLEDVMVQEYARKLVMGVSAHKSELDRAISQSSQNWAIDRMPVVDRCILRLAIYEMRYEDAVPVSVSINEAVELAKIFGGEDDSHRFVNGVLGKISRADEAGAAFAPAAEDAPGAGDVQADDCANTIAEPVVAAADGRDEPPASEKDA